SQLQKELVDLRRRAQNAKAAVRTRDAFLARMSHDLRTPLSSILGFSQLLEMDQLEPSQRSNDDHILMSGRTRHKLLTSAIEIAYVAAVKLTLIMQPVGFVGLLNDCVSMVRVEAVEAGVTIVVTAPELDAPLVFSTYAQCTSQIFLNLLSNAFKA